MITIRLAAVALFAAIVGCGAMPPADPPADRPTTSSAKDRCRAMGVPESYVDGQFVLYRAARGDGFEQVRTLAAAQAVCADACADSDDEDCAGDCYTCNAMIIDEVWR